MSALVITMALTTGCTFRQKADTILKITPVDEASKAVEFGVGQVVWGNLDDRIVVLGRGVHPREHESYAYFVNEPYPAFRPRWIRITHVPSGTSNQKWIIEVWLHQFMIPSDRSDYAGASQFQKFTGTLDDPPTAKGSKRTFVLQDIAVRSTDSDASTWQLNGRIVAARGTDEEMKRFSQWLEEEVALRFEHEDRNE